MNRIYKVIWSKVKHQYVVVSELAHRDGKRSSAATTSRATWRALAVALMLTSSLAAVPYMGYALDGGTATQSQYIAVAMEPKDGAGHYENHFKLGEGWVKEWVPDNSRKFGNYTYHLQTVTVNGEPKQYWVREGYDITVTQNQARYPSINQGTDYIIDAQKNEDYTEQSDQGLLQAYQTTTSAGDITTLTGVNIEDLNTGVYGGASNTAGVETPSKWGYHIQVGGTGSDSEGYLKVSDDLDGTSSGRPAGATGNTNFGTYFSHNVTLQNGVYVYTDREGKTVNVPTNKVYSIDGKLGVFTDANGNLYTGDVYGDNNEILLSGVGEGNQIYTYWGTKLTDPTQTIGNMTVEHYNKDRIELQQQSAAYHGDDIKDITVNQNENGGSFSFNRLGKYNKNTGKYEDADPAGVITIKNTATSGKSGNDVAIEFSNGTNSFTVQAGSKVEGTTGEASSNTLTGLSINGVDYKLGGGKSVTSGAINANGTITLKQGENDNTGITLTGKIHDYALDAQTADAANGEVTLTGKDRYSNDNAFEVKIDGLVTEDTLGDQIVNSNNLKVAADADGDDNKGNWTITDTSKPEGQQVFTNTTLVNGAATAVEDSAVTSGDGEDAKTYGQSYAIKDTEGNTVTISDVASASALKDVDVLVTQNTSSIQTLQGQTVNGGSITDDGTIELKHDTTTLASISGLHDYALDAQTADAANGEVTLTGKDRYGNDNAFEVKIDGLVTEDTLGDQIVNSNNLKVAADADGDDNKGNWTITDTSKPEGQQVFTNTTLVNGAATAVEDSAVTSGDGEDAKTYGQSYAIKDTEGNTVTISDVASASALKDVDVLVTQNTSSIQTLQGQTVNGGSITDDGTIELKHDTTTLASISGLHDYALDAQTADAANGEVTLTGKDRYGNDNAFEVKIDGLVTEDTLGDQIVNSNNLKVAADADGDDNKGNWTITDTSKPEGQQVFTNTTLVNGAATAVEDSAVTSGDGEDAKTYGQSYAIKDTEGNTVTISDVASASALKDVDVLVTQNTSSIQTLQGQTVNGGSITDDGTIELKHDTTTLASISGLHDYALDAQTADAANGEVTLTGKDRYGNDNAFEVKIDGLVTEDTLGDQIVNSNNLKVAAGDKGRWTITDTSKPEGEQVFANTTLADAVKKEGSKDNGYTYTVSDTAGNTAVIEDVASAQKLTEVAAEVGKHTSMTVDGGKAAGTAEYNGGNLLLKDNGKDGQHQYDVKLNDDIYLGGNQTADNRNIALEGSTGSIHAATTEGNHTFDFNSNGGKFETTTVDDSLLVDMPIIGIIGKNGVVTTTTNTSEFNQRGATFTKTGKTETYVGDHIITTTPIPKTSTNINGSKITSDAGVLGGQTVVDGGSVTVQGVGSILGTNTTTVEGSKITSVGTWGSLLGDTTEIDGAYINAGGIEVNGEPLRDTITGLSNTEWKNDEAWQKTHIRDDRAATEGQLQDVADSLSGDVSKLDDFAVKYDEVNGKPNYDKVTLEGKDGTKITNLAKGEVTATSKDAVNGSQLFEVQELAGKHTTMTVNNGMVAPENGSYTTDGNLQLKQKVDDKGQIEYDVKLNDNLVLGEGDSQITLNGAPTDENAPAISVGEVFTVGQDGSVHAAVAGDSTSDSMSFTNGGLTISNMSGDVSSATVIKGADIQAGGIHLDGTDKIIDGLSNIEWTGMTTTPDKAATEGQLQMVSDRVASGWTATDDKGHEINVNPNTHPTLNFASGKNITVSAENDEINVALNDNVYLGEDNAIALEGSTGHISATVKDSLGMSSNTLTFDDKGLTVSKDAMGVGSGSTNIIGDMITTTDENGNETTIDGGKVTTEALEVNGNSDNTMTFDAAEGLNVNTGDAQLNVSEDGLSLNVDNGAGSNNSVKITQDGTTFSYSENGVTGATTTVIQGQKITAGDVLINGEDGKNTITGLTNTTWKNDAAWQADNIVADRAATEGQLQQAAAASKTTLSNGKNTTVTSKTAEYGHVDYQVNLNDYIVLGDQDGKNNNISINGNEASIILNGFENGEYKNSIEIDAASGMITGLTNAIGDGKDGWETFTDKDTVHGSRAVTEDDLYEVYRHGVQYSVNDDGTPDYTTIVLGNPYNANTKGGGTRITNVAYAETDRKSTEYDGSAAVNVDVLNDAVDNATATVTGNEKHIATNVGPKAEMPHADYSVGEDGKVTLTEVDGNGKPTGNSVVISDVASATDVGNVDKLVDAGLGVDENGNSNVVDAILDVDNKVGDLNYNDVKGDSIQNGDDTTTAIGKLDNRIDGLETDISDAAEEAKKHNTVEAGSNIVVTTSPNANGGTEYKVSVDPNLKVDTVTASGNIDAGSFSTGDITINKDNSGTINGLSNTTWNKEVADAIAANANGEAGTAATQGQLQQAMNGAVQYDTNKDGSVNKDSITLGGSTYDPETHKGGTTITNVADGKNASDAVNMSQLWQTNQAVINNSNNIQSLSNQVGKLDNRIDEVGAGAAALAALHPLDFDPDDKWDFSAGYGNYRGESAVAVGAFYRPNEDTMFSVGGTVGNGDNMVNAGVSFKIGQGNSVSTSRVAMAKEIKSMRDIVAKQDAQIQKLTAMVNALVGIQSEPDTTTMFPDVPENHWAYEAVETMAKTGLVKGYPDGEFKGDRTMTRYEFAQIVYNAIQAGAEVDARLVEEFKPELEYFHIATVAKDKDGNPTIERVRAN